MPTENEFLSDGVNEVGQDVSAFEAPDIGPEEYAEHMANVLANALQSTKIFGVVEVAAGVGQVNVMGRVRRDRERIFLEKVVAPVLLTMEKNDDIEGFVGKQYLPRDGTIKYAWVISYASNDLKAATFSVCQAFEAAIPRMEVTEAPLMGPPTPQSGGASTGRKGAAPVR